MERHHHQQEHAQPGAAASGPDRARYDPAVLREWPRLDAPPRVWIGSLLDYEAGLLHGRWIGVGRPGVEIQDDIDGLLSRSPTAERTGRAAARWAIFEAEGFGDATVDPHDDVERLSRLGLRISAYGGAFTAWARLHEHDLVGQRGFREAYLGHYRSVRDYIELYVDAHNVERLAEAAVPAEVRPYIELNVAQLAADVVEYGDVLVIPNPDGGVWLYDGRPAS